MALVTSIKDFFKFLQVNELLCLVAHTASHDHLAVLGDLIGLVLGNVQTWRLQEVQEFL